MSNVDPPSIDLPSLSPKAAKTKSLMPKNFQDPLAQRIVALAGLVFALGGTGVLSYRAASRDAPTSQETASLQAELKRTQDQLSETKLGAISEQMDQIVIRLERLEQTGIDQRSATDLRQDKQIRFIGELTALHNRGSPSPGYPVPDREEWYSSVKGGEPFRSKRGAFPSFEKPNF